MKELSLNILDIAQNSISANAKNIQIILNEDEKGILTLRIIDDGKGMSKEVVESVTNPFYTTRQTRKVGMGIPLLKLACEQAEGYFEIDSKTIENEPENHGTTVCAVFNTKSIDFTPIGDIVDTLCVLLQGNPEIDFYFEHITPEIEVKLSTKELKEILGEDVSIGEFEVLEWVKAYLKEQYSSKKNSI